MSKHFKTCTKCNKRKPITDFHKVNRVKSGYGARCRPCINKLHNAWLTPEYAREQNLKRAFGITSDDYNKILLEQHDTCAICNQPETTVWKGKVQALSVDHNHDTGKIRGLLCNSCNRALGKFRDNRAILQSAVKYLEKHQ